VIAPRLLLEVDAGERLPVRVADDVAGVRLFGGPGRREAALGRGPLVNRRSVIIPHHRRVIQRFHDSSGESDLITGLGAPQELMMWWFVALLLLLCFSAWTSLSNRPPLPATNPLPRLNQASASPFSKIRDVNPAPRLSKFRKLPPGVYLSFAQGRYVGPQSHSECAFMACL
jgi:hypothetical protein